MTTGNDKFYRSVSGESGTDSGFSVPAVVLDHEPGPVDEDILLLSDETAAADLGDDLFRQLMGGEEPESDDDVLDSLFSVADGSLKECELDIFTEDDDPGEGTLSEASVVDPELLECFNEEAADHLENLSARLNELSAAVGEPCRISEEYRGILHSIRRSVHTMKGAAAVIGIESVAGWGHDFEDFLDWLHDESDLLTPEIIALLLEGSDLLEKIAVNPDLSVEDETSSIRERFSEITISAKEASAPPPPTVDPELLESYHAEVEEHLGNIGRQLNQLSSSVGDYCPVSDAYRESLYSIFRSVHTIKGTAAAVGVETVAGWGHAFEDFLNNFNRDSNFLSPETITAMLEGTDILKKLVLDPVADVRHEITALQKTFQDIAAQTAVEADKERSPEDKLPEVLDSELADVVELERKHLFSDKAGAGVRSASLNSTNSVKERRNRRRETTLRVGSRKVAGIMGLNSDLAVNLGSFENSATSMQAGLAEFEATLQRLKVVVANLESSYELAFIPHSGSASGNTPGKEIEGEFDPLEMDRYSEFNIMIRSLNEAVVDLDSVREQISGSQNQWSQAVDRQRRTVNDMQSAVQSIQMAPFSTISNRLYRTVREAAKSSDKQVRLLIEDGFMEMATHVWDILADALMHMLRNCVDHGVEPPEIRQMIGKSAQATIRIQCSRSGSRFILRLSDDGSGLDYDAIRNRALKLYPDAGVEQMDNGELTELIFKQGFSVKETATALSGRGVGLDVVRNTLTHLNGLIEVQSVPGQGTEFTLSVPIVVALLPVLMVEFGRQRFAVPMRDISRVFRLSGQEIEMDSLELDGEKFPLIRPTELFRLRRSAERNPDGLIEDSALAVDVGGCRGILVADVIIGQRNVVLKSLGSHLQNIPFIAGATVLGDGTLVPILKTEDLLKRTETSGPCGDQGYDCSEDETPLKILIVDDSISIRKVLNRVLSAQGWQVTEAVDGADAMEKISVLEPEFIFLDIEMPRMNGFEVLQALQSQSICRDIPILMLTSRSAEKYKRKASELGASGFVTKPFKDDKLVALVNSFTSKE